MKKVYYIIALFGLMSCQNNNAPKLNLEIEVNESPKIQGLIWNFIYISTVPIYVWSMVSLIFNITNQHHKNIMNPH